MFLACQSFSFLPCIYFISCHAILLLTGGKLWFSVSQKSTKGDIMAAAIEFTVYIGILAGCFLLTALMGAL